MGREYHDRFRVADVIDYLGGIAATAKLLGVSATAVGQFRRRNCFPASRALQIADHLGVTPEWFHNPWVDVDTNAPMADIEELEKYLKHKRAELPEVE